MMIDYDRIFDLDCFASSHWTISFYIQNDMIRNLAVPKIIQSKDITSFCLNIFNIYLSCFVRNNFRIIHIRI